jgi:hypothetical protein
MRFSLKKLPLKVSVKLPLPDFVRHLSKEYTPVRQRDFAGARRIAAADQRCFR